MPCRAVSCVLMAIFAPMSAVKYSREIQAQFVAYLLHKKTDSQGVPLSGRVQKGVKLFKHFRELDQAVFEATFKVSGFGKIMEVLGEYYAKHKDLPTHTTYKQVAAKNKSYELWLSKADAHERVELNTFENLIFSTPQDIPYIETELLNFLAQSYAAMISKEQRDELKDDTEDAFKVIMKKARQVQNYIRDLINEFAGNRDEQKDIVTEDVDLASLRQLPGIETCFRSVTLYYRGITIIVAPPKSFKTGLTQNIAVYLMLKGYHVGWIDLENGLNRSVRRFYQNLLKVPKEWVYSNTYVHKEKMPYPEHKRGKGYRSGDKVFKVVSEATGAKVEIFSAEAGRTIKVDEYVTYVKGYEALIDNAEDVDEWKEFEIDVHGAIEPLQDVLNRRLKEIRQTSGGQVRVRYIKNCTPSKIRQVAEDWRDDETDFFSDDEIPKILIIDWMQHLSNEDKKLAHWEVIRQNYSELKVIREELDLYMLGIEAMKEYEKAADPHWSLKNLKVAGTDRIQYDAEAVTVVIGTDEEKKRGYRRLVKAEDRDGPSGDHTVEFVGIDYELQVAQSIPIEAHLEACPEFWEAKKAGPPRNLKKSFGGEKGPTEAKGLEFPELTADDLGD